MKKSRKNKLILLFLFILFNVGLDQLSKSIVREKIDYNQNIALIDGYLTLTKVENTGAFLSIGDELPEALRVTLLNLLPILVLAFGFYYLYTQDDLPTPIQIGMCCLLGGGIGNIYDRIKFGSVTDFLHIDLGFVSTGVFNVADMSIMTGIGILLLQSFKRKIVA